MIACFPLVTGFHQHVLHKWYIQQAFWVIHNFLQAVDYGRYLKQRNSSFELELQT
jgi:hypothetical protein